MTSGERYTEEEKENIRRVHASGKTYKSMAHLWPTRAPRDVARHAVHMRLGPRPIAFDRSGSYILPALIEAVQKHPGRAYDIATRLGINKEYAGRLLRAQCAANPQTVHIETWVRCRPGGMWIEYWSFGPGLNAEKPQPIPRAVRRRTQRAVSNRKNPFMSMLGPVAAPTGQPGRVYHHLWDEPEQEAA